MALSKEEIKRRRRERSKRYYHSEQGQRKAKEATKRRYANPEARAKLRARCREYYQRNKKKILEKTTARRRAFIKTPEGKIKQREYALRYRCWDIKEYNKIFEKQHGLCEIVSCKRPISAADHDHTRKVPRGLLCKKCNWTLGLVRESPAILRELACYLEKYENKFKTLAEKKKGEQQDDKVIC